MLCFVGTVEEWTEQSVRALRKSVCARHHLSIDVWYSGVPWPAFHAARHSEGHGTYSITQKQMQKRPLTLRLAC